MVFFTVKRSLRAASCCSLLVVNGGTGFRFFSFVTTDSTMKVGRLQALENVVGFRLVLDLSGLAFDLRQLALRTAAAGGLRAWR